jgi:hypothetical protein
MRSTILERAFELAGSGSCRKITEIAITLRKEGYSAVDQTLSGGGIRQQLRAIMKSGDAAPKPRSRGPSFKETPYFNGAVPCAKDDAA